MQTEPIPVPVRNAAGNEPYDFIVQSEHEQSIAQLVVVLIFGLLWVSVSGFFMWGMLDINPGETLQKLPLIGAGVFMLIGLAIVLSAIYSMFSKGPWYIIGEKRFIIVRKSSSRSITWDQFTGETQITGLPPKQNLILTLNQGNYITHTSRPIGMRTGKLSTSMGRSRTTYSPQRIYIIGVSNAADIEQAVRKRIQEAAVMQVVQAPTKTPA